MNNKTVKVYKVVKKSHSGSGYISCRSPYPFSYFVGNPTSSPEAPIFAFGTVENARQFITNNFGGMYCDIILECSAGISKYNPKRICCRCGDSGNFWKLTRGKKKVTVKTFPTPEGTVFCEWIIPHKELTDCG